MTKERVKEIERKQIMISNGGWSWLERILNLDLSTFSWSLHLLLQASFPRSDLSLLSGLNLRGEKNSLNWGRRAPYICNGSDQNIKSRSVQLLAAIRCDPHQMWCDPHASILNSPFCLISPDFAWFLQSKNQDIAVPHSRYIQCKRYNLLVQNMNFRYGNRSKW